MAAVAEAEAAAKEQVKAAQGLARKAAAVGKSAAAQAAEHAALLNAISAEKASDASNEFRLQTEQQRRAQAQRSIGGNDDPERTRGGTATARACWNRTGIVLKRRNHARIPDPAKID